MIHVSAIAESIVAPSLLRSEFSHSLDPKRTFRLVSPIRHVPQSSGSLSEQMTAIEKWPTMLLRTGHTLTAEVWVRKRCQSMWCRCVLFYSR